MNLSAPKQIVWIIAVVLGVIGILAHVVPIAAIAPYAFWLVTVAFILLALGTVLKGM